MGLFDQHEEPLREERVEEQTAKVAALEDDKGVVTTTYNSISNSLYDLADSNSKTTTVLLPNGTTIRLAATSRPGLGSYRATFEVTAKGGEPQTVYGNTSATDLAFKLDVLALSAKQKAALQRMSEVELLEMAREHLQEEKVNVSGYVTKRGRHVGAYTQIRKVVSALKRGQSADLPDGVIVTRHKSGDGFSIHNPHAFRGAGSTHRLTNAAGPDPVSRATTSALAASAGSEHPKSIGGKQRHHLVRSAKDVNAIPADNPKLPGTPHPEAVADKAAKALKRAKLPSRKQRAENERKAGKPKMSSKQSRYLANVKRQATKVERSEMLDDGRLNVVWRQGGQRMAVNVQPDGEIDRGPEASGAMAKRDAREREEKARRRANDESGMPASSASRANPTRSEHEKGRNTRSAPPPPTSTAGSGRR